jgi:hypothetical protein
MVSIAAATASMHAAAARRHWSFGRPTKIVRISAAV